MAKNLGLKVIAEGIETSAQLEALRMLECESGQGYLLARPMSADELAAFLTGTDIDAIPPPSFDVSFSPVIQ
jgi:EAL domain-containing protein (putative c-di-GMP-specific phosphodiesterase class I)